MFRSWTEHRVQLSKTHWCLRMRPQSCRPVYTLLNKIQLLNWNWIFFLKLNIEIYPVHCVPLHWDWQGVQAALFFYTLVFDLFFSLTCIGGRETIAPQSSSAQRWSWKGHPREEDLQHDGYKVYKFKISPCFPSSQWTQGKWVTSSRSKDPFIEIENPFMVGELF